MAVPRIFLCSGVNSAHFYGLSRIQTGFLLRRFAFTPTQKAVSKTFKETRNNPTNSNTMLENKTFSFPGGDNCPTPAMHGLGNSLTYEWITHYRIDSRVSFTYKFSKNLQGNEIATRHI